MCETIWGGREKEILLFTVKSILFRNKHLNKREKTRTLMHRDSEPVLSRDKTTKEWDGEGEKLAILSVDYLKFMLKQFSSALLETIFISQLRYTFNARDRKRRKTKNSLLFRHQVDGCAIFSSFSSHVRKLYLPRTHSQRTVRERCHSFEFYLMHGNHLRKK